MREVIIKAWIPPEWIDSELGRVKDPTTGRFSLSFSKRGMFHKWGVSYEEFEAGPGNFTVAIVEFEDGTVEMVLPSNLKFNS